MTTRASTYLKTGAVGALLCCAVVVSIAANHAAAADASSAASNGSRNDVGAQGSSTAPYPGTSAGSTPSMLLVCLFLAVLGSCFFDLIFIQHTNVVSPAARCAFVGTFTSTVYLLYIAVHVSLVDTTTTNNHPVSILGGTAMKGNESNNHDGTSQENLHRGQGAAITTTMGPQLPAPSSSPLHLSLTWVLVLNAYVLPSVAMYVLLGRLPRYLVGSLALSTTQQGEDDASSSEHGDYNNNNNKNNNNRKYTSGRITINRAAVVRMTLIISAWLFLLSTMWGVRWFGPTATSPLIDDNKLSKGAALSIPPETADTAGGAQQKPGSGGTGGSASPTDATPNGQGNDQGAGEGEKVATAGDKKSLVARNHTTQMIAETTGSSVVDTLMLQLLKRVGWVGVTVMAFLSGFGAVSTPLGYLKSTKESSSVHSAASSSSSTAVGAGVSTSSSGASLHKRIQLMATSIGLRRRKLWALQHGSACSSKGGGGGGASNPSSHQPQGGSSNKGDGRGDSSCSGGGWMAYVVGAVTSTVGGFIGSGGRNQAVRDLEDELCGMERVLSMQYLRLGEVPYIEFVAGSSSHSTTTGINNTGASSSFFGSFSTPGGGTTPRRPSPSNFAAGAAGGGPPAASKWFTKQAIFMVLVRIRAFVFLILGVSLSCFCVCKCLVATYNLLLGTRRDGDDPITRIVKLTLSEELNLWVQPLSLVFNTTIVLSSVRSFLILTFRLLTTLASSLTGAARSTTTTTSTSSSSSSLASAAATTSSVVVVVFSWLMGVNNLALLLLIRSSLPPIPRARLSSELLTAVGAGVAANNNGGPLLSSSSTAAAFPPGLLFLQHFHQWFDAVFIGTAAVTFVVLRYLQTD